MFDFICKFTIRVKIRLSKTILSLQESSFQGRTYQDPQTLLNQFKYHMGFIGPICPLGLQTLCRVKRRDIKELGRVYVTVIWDKADQYWPLIWRPWASCHLFYEHGTALWDLSSWEEGSTVIHPRWLRDLTSSTFKTCTDWLPPVPSDSMRHDFQTDPWAEKGAENQSG